MKKLDKKTKLIISFVVAVIIVGGIAWYFKAKGAAGLKAITIEVLSTRDNYKKSETYKTKEEFLGAFLKAEDLVKYEDSSYGIYIREVEGMKDDQANQYWWAISVDKEMSTTGVSEVPLKDGSTYTLELKQGF